MNKKIKIIDLLNKVANGEEVPEIIVYQDKIFVKSKDNDYTTDDGVPLVHLLNYNLSNLNDDVEILKDNTEEIEEIEELNASRFVLTPLDEEIIDRINKLVNATNKIRKDLNKC